MVTLALAGEMLAIGGSPPARSRAGGWQAQVLDNGKAADRFARMVTGLGGPADFMEQPGRYLVRP